MTKAALFGVVFVIGEMIAFFVFKILNHLLLKGWEFRIDLSVVKGMAERLFLFLSLVYGFPHSLIAFGALKVGTRIRPDSKISNDYFFIGNILSLLLTMFYYVLWKGLRH